jgi:chromosome segregation ATPase
MSDLDRQLEDFAINQDAAREAREANDEIKRLESKLAACEKQRDDSAALSAAFQSRLDAMSAQLAACEKERDDWKSLYSSSSSRNFSLDEQITANRHLIAALTKEREELRAERDFAGEELTKLESVLRAAQFLLLQSLKVEVSGQMGDLLGGLNLAVREHYDWRTTKITAK